MAFPIAPCPHLSSSDAVLPNPMCRGRSHHQPPPCPRRPCVSSYQRRPLNKTFRQRPSKMWLLTATPRTCWNSVARTLPRACHRESRCRPPLPPCSAPTATSVRWRPTPPRHHQLRRQPATLPALLQARRYRGALRPPCHLLLLLFPSHPAAACSPCPKRCRTGSRRTPAARLSLQIH